MLTILQVAERLGVSKQTVRNHLKRLGLWDGAERDDSGSVLLTSDDASAVAASLSTTARAARGRPTGLSKEEAFVGSTSQNVTLELVAVWRERAEDAERRAGEDRKELRETRAALSEALSEVATLSGAEASARALCKALEAEVGRLHAENAELRAEITSSREEISRLGSSVEAVRNASFFERIRGFRGLLPPSLS